MNQFADAVEEQVDFAQAVLYIEEFADSFGIPYSQLVLHKDPDWVLHTAMFRLVRQVAYIRGITLVKFPRTWWDHLKAREVERSPIMRWWVKRHPIQYWNYEPRRYFPSYPLPKKLGKSDFRFAKVDEK